MSRALKLTAEVVNSKIDSKIKTRIYIMKTILAVFKKKLQPASQMSNWKFSKKYLLKRLIPLTASEVY